MVSRNRSLGLVMAVALAGAGLSAHAAVVNWTKDATGIQNWTTTANWSSSPVPTTGDEAVFNKTLTAERTVTVDASRGIKTITFDNPSIYKYTLSGGSLQLDNGGLIRTAATNGNHTDTITSATIAIQGDGGSAVFTAGATSATSVLSIGAVTGVSTGVNITTLTLNGTNTGANAITGIIGNGVGGGKLAVVKNGTGTWKLTNTGNTYSGGTTLSEGTVNITTATSPFGTGLFTLNGGTLIKVGDIVPSIANNLTIAASSTIKYDTTGAAKDRSLSFTGTTTFGTTTDISLNYSLFGTGTTTGQDLAFTGAVVLATDVTFTGNHAPTSGSGSGTLKFSSATGSINIGSGGNRNLTFNDSGSVLFQGAISGTNTLTIKGTNTFAVNVGDTTGVTGSTGGIIIEDGRTVVFGNGATALKNTFTGGITINNGVAKLGNSDSTQSHSIARGNIITINTNGTLDMFNKVLDIAGLNGNGGSVDVGVEFANADRTLTLSGSENYASAAVLRNSTRSPTRQLVLNKTGSGTQILSGINTYTGTTTISGGTLQFAKPGSLYNSVTGSWTSTNIVVASGGTFVVNVGGANDFTTGNVTTLLTNLGGLGAFLMPNTGLQAGSRIGFDTTNATGAVTLADNITNSNGAGGAIGLSKLGTGTLILTGINTYTGATTVKGGTLKVIGSMTSAVTVEYGAILGGTGAMGTVTINNGGTASPGNSPAAQNVGDYTLNTGANYDWEYQGDAVGQKYDQYKLATGKTLNLAGKWALNLFNLGGTPVADLATRYYIFDTTGANLTGLGVVAGSAVQLTPGTHYTINYGTSGYGNVRVYADADGIGTDGIYIIHVPEPTSLSLLGLGAASLLLRRRRKV